MKAHFFILAMLCLIQSVSSQIIYQGLDIHYDNNGEQDMRDPSYVSSDFGPRDLTAVGRSAYDWHQGIDFSPEANNIDLGWPLRAIEGGNVVSIVGTATGIKYIVIDCDNNDPLVWRYTQMGFGVRAEECHGFTIEIT